MYTWQPLFLSKMLLTVVEERTNLSLATAQDHTSCQSANSRNLRLQFVWVTKITQ